MQSITDAQDIGNDWLWSAWFYKGYLYPPIQGSGDMLEEGMRIF